MKLLIVDDEAHIRQMMRLTLEAAGYHVDEAATGEDGVAQFAGGSYDAVLLDQKMPGIDGLQTLRQIKTRAPNACVVMVTAFASIDLAVDAMRLGATDFLRKPMTPEALRGSVAAALATRPRTPIAQPAGPEVVPPIQRLTLNGFRIVRAEGTRDPARAAHVFQVKHFPDGAEVNVTVTIDPEAVARVGRLTRRHLNPGGGFWCDQAERLLSAYLWSEGKVPEYNRLTVQDVSREDLDLVGSWTGD